MPYEIGFENIESVGYCFQIDLARRAVQEGPTVAEVLITFSGRAILRDELRLAARKVKDRHRILVIRQTSSQLGNPCWHMPICAMAACPNPKCQQ